MPTPDAEAVVEPFALAVFADHSHHHGPHHQQIRTPRQPFDM
jgi:hypothetical protein